MVRGAGEEVAAVISVPNIIGFLMLLAVLLVGVLAWVLCRAAGKADEAEDYMTGDD